MPVAFSVPDVAVTLVAAIVVTVGAAGVVKVMALPTPVPTEFEASAQTKYVVPGERPEMLGTNETFEKPAPRFEPPLRVGPDLQPAGFQGKNLTR